MVPRAKNASWSATEDDAFLRAWTSVVERERDGSFHRALFETFVELCGGATETQRTETSLMQRRGVYMRMYDIVCGFHNRHNAPPPLASDACDGASQSTEPYSSDDYFELSRAEQRRWIASLDPRTLSMLDIDRTAFERVQRIILVSDPDRAQRPPFWRRERLPSKTASESSSSSKVKPEKVKKRRGSSNTKSQGSSSAVSPAHRSARHSSDGGGGDDSGSSTESDDDMAHPRRPSSARASDLSDAASRGTSSTEAATPSESGAHSTAATLADPLASETQSLALDSATANLVRLVDLLRDQATRLHSMFTQAEQERARDSRERQRAVKMMRVSRDHVLEHVRRCERTLKQGRDECEKERAAVERELKRLKESNLQQETHVPDAS